MDAGPIVCVVTLFHRVLYDKMSSRFLRFLHLAELRSQRAVKVT